MQTLKELHIIIIIVCSIFSRLLNVNECADITFKLFVYSYSVVSSRSGIQNDQTSFVGCDHGKVLFM